MTAFAVLFPGQGSQFVGMGADLFDARPDLLGEVADETLGFSLRALCLEGPEGRLTRTEHAQPALFALSYALWSELVPHLARPAAGAGHSLGEYSALAAAGVFEYPAALGLVAERGRAMAEASDAQPSTMAAVIGAERAEVEALAADHRAQGGKLWVANVNAPGQVVVAGGVADIDRLVAAGPELGLRRVIPLAVAGAFHSPLMASAATRLSHALAMLAPLPPAFPVYSNVTAAPVQAGEVGDLLVRQVVSPVLFSETLTAMAASGIDTFVHVGPGDVTAGLVRRVTREAEVVVVSGMDDIPEAAAALGTMDG